MIRLLDDDEIEQLISELEEYGWEVDQEDVGMLINFGRVVQLKIKEQEWDS